MSASGTGATYGDAIIAALGFAERHPWRFLLTVPFTLCVAGWVILILFRIVLIGPVSRHRKQYEAERTKHRRNDEPRLPL